MGCSRAGAADERGGAAAGAGGGADAARGRQQDGLLRRVSPSGQQGQALPGAREARWQASAPGLLRHRRGGSAVRRAVAGGADGGREGAAAPPLTSKEALQQARETTIRAVALDIIYEAAGAATAELSAEVAAEVMAGIAMGL
eukprot:scaffold4664_cov54-Phaeocystis_antarctica.AAC.1